MTSGGQGKIRIAHVPNVEKLLNAKKEILKSGTVSTIPQDRITFKNNKEQKTNSTVALTNAVSRINFYKFRNALIIGDLIDPF